MVLNHIISGELSAADITDAVGTGGGSIVVQTFAGSDLQVTTGDGGAVFVQSRGLEAPGALVTATDVPTCGGVVHVIDAVLLPTQLDGSEVAFLTDGMLPSTGPMLAPDMAPGIWCRTWVRRWARRWVRAWARAWPLEACLLASRPWVSERCGSRHVSEGVCSTCVMPDGRGAQLGFVDALRCWGCRGLLDRNV